MNINTNSVAIGQGPSVSTSSDQNTTRVRSMSDEQKAECGKALAKEIASYPANSSISLNKVREDFSCDSNVAYAIIRKACDIHSRYFKVNDDVKGTTPRKRPKLTFKSLITGRVHFDRANENEKRPENMKFVLGDEFDVEFPEDDWNKVILTRVRPGSASTETVEEA